MTERDAFTGLLSCVFDGGVGMVQIFDKLFQDCFTVAPHGEDIIDISPPDERLGVGIRKKFIF